MSVGISVGNAVGGASVGASVGAGTSSVEPSPGASGVGTSGRAGLPDCENVGNPITMNDMKTIRRAERDNHVRRFFFHIGEMMPRYNTGVVQGVVANMQQK